MTLEADLVKTLADLDAKWWKLKDSSRRVLDSELAATKAMEKLLDDTIRSSAPAHERVGAAVAELLTWASGIGDEVNKYIIAKAKEYGERNPGSAINEQSAKDLTDISKLGAPVIDMAKSLGITVGMVVKALPFLVRDPGMIVTDNLVAGLTGGGQGTLSGLGDLRKGLVAGCLGPYAQRVEEVHNALPFQGIMVASLSETRDDVARFMERNGVDAARKVKDASEDAFETWVSGQAKPGNHDDAVDIRLAMEAPLQKRFDRLVAKLQEFVRQWDGVFLGTLNADARKAIVDQEEWDRQMSHMAGLGFDERLRVWKESVLTIDPKLGDAWTQVQDAFAGFPVDLQYALMQRIKALWDPLIAEVRKEATALVTDLDQAARVAGEEQRRRDLDRSAALAKLPA